ncbi:MAG: DNA mismatch repair protein MutS, partial [Maribacter sp.]|nr:DNA mismatch repair protein MutS [Maribacter sp.]
MQDLVAFYNNQISIYSGELSQVKKQLYTSSMFRLAVFCLAVIGVYFSMENTRLVWAIITITIVLFIFLVSRHSDLEHKRDRLRALLQINTTEIEVLHRRFQNLPDGSAYKNPEHHFSQDIDLFGRGSFYQYANRTVLKQGSDVFTTLLLENSIEGIPAKQEAIKELGQMPEWRQNFSAIASLVKTETPFNVITKWLKRYQAFVPNYMRYFTLLFSLVSVAIIAMYFLDLLNGWGVILWLLIGLGVTGTYLKKINKLSAATSKIQSTFHQYQKLIVVLENTQFAAGLLNDQQAIVLREKVKTSKILEAFSKILNALDQRNNMVFGFLGNAFFLWDLQQSFKIERWIQNHGKDVESWFKVIAFFDAYNSLGNFAFNHPEYSFPKISDERSVLKSEEAGHPLLDPKKRILNDFQIDKEQF